MLEKGLASSPLPIANQAKEKKLSVEKAIEKLRASDQEMSGDQRRDEKTDARKEEMRRMRAQRTRVDRPKRD
jgi:hypothetical protein